jgi:isoleucyl-tRNA synthetase
VLPFVYLYEHNAPVFQHNKSDFENCIKYNTTLNLPSISEDGFYETACSVLQNDCSQERCDEYGNEIIQQITKSNWVSRENVIHRGHISYLLQNTFYL